MRVADVIGASAVGFIVGATLVGLTFFLYLGTHCTDVSQWAGLANALGASVPPHVVVCSTP